MLKPYLETAFQGKQDKKFKDVAGPELRKGHLAKDQCKRNFFPQGRVIGLCWDNGQKLAYKKHISNDEVFKFNGEKVIPENLILPLIYSKIFWTVILRRYTQLGLTS